MRVGDVGLGALARVLGVGQRAQQLLALLLDALLCLGEQAVEPGLGARLRFLRRRLGGGALWLRGCFRGRGLWRLV